MLDETMHRPSADEVLALAPDRSSQLSARGLATSTAWPQLGHSPDPPSLWGLCRGSGAQPYQVCVELTEPAYRCSCPSRKIPCKHALALMLLWCAGGMETASPPEWVVEWQTSRTDRNAKARTRAEARARGAAAHPDGAEVTGGEQAANQSAANQPSKSQQRRAARVEAGVQELDRWLTDQVRQGIAGASRAGYAHWDTMAARLVDAQAPGLASSVRRLAGVAATPDSLLTELSLVRLLVSAYHRVDDLPGDLAATVRTRIGFPVSSDHVLAQPPIRDQWAVIGVRDEGQERLTVRRVWLRGESTSRSALVLSFAPAGQPLTTDLPLGTTVDADLCFFPGALPLRALIAATYTPPEPFAEPPGAVSVGEALDDYARALAAEPWTSRWPMLLHGVVPVRDRAGRWHLRDGACDALVLDPVIAAPWRLVAAAGGAPVTVAGEWTSTGLRPLTAWTGGRVVRA